MCLASRNRARGRGRVLQGSRARDIRRCQAGPGKEERLMDPVHVVSGPIQVLDRPDVDTDQIIPKQFLKRIERSGFGEFLFYDWRKEGLELEEGRAMLVTGRNFGCGCSREH